MASFDLSAVWPDDQDDVLELARELFVADAPRQSGNLVGDPTDNDRACYRSMALHAFEAARAFSAVRNGR